MNVDETNTVERDERGRWLASGNPAGRPQGARNKLATDFLKDAAAAWQQHGVAALDKMAQDEPAKFVRVMADLVPKDVQLTLSQRTPGGLEADDWAVALSCFRAIREAMPDAEGRSPAAVFELVIEAIRAHTAPTIDDCMEKPQPKSLPRMPRNKAFSDP